MGVGGLVTLCTWKFGQNGSWKSPPLPAMERLSALTLPCPAMLLRWEKKSGEEFGQGGFWKKWTLLKGTNEEGTVRLLWCLTSPSLSLSLSLPADDCPQGFLGI